MIYNDIDGEQEAERPVVFRRKKGKSRIESMFIIYIIILFGITLACLIYVGIKNPICTVQAEQTGISAARDTQRIEALLTKQDELISDLTALQKEWYGDGFPYLTTARQDCGINCHN